VTTLANALRLADTIARAFEQGDAPGRLQEIAKSDVASYLDISEPQLAQLWPELRTLFFKCRLPANGNENEILRVVTDRPAPSSRSIRPTKRPTKAASMVPKLFPCTVCKQPSFGNRCEACGGYVCPEHQVGSEGWCTDCTTKLHAYVDEHGLPKPLTIGLSVAAVTLALSTLAGAWVSEGHLAPKAFLGPILFLVLFAVLVFVSRRALQRIGFLRFRRNHSPARESVPADITPLIERAPSPSRLPDAEPGMSLNLPASLSMPAVQFSVRNVESLRPSSIPLIREELERFQDGSGNEVGELRVAEELGSYEQMSQGLRPQRMESETIKIFPAMVPPPGYGAAAGASDPICAARSAASGSDRKRPDTQSSLAVGRALGADAESEHQSDRARPGDVQRRARSLARGFARRSAHGPRHCGARGRCRACRADGSQGRRSNAGVE
jgi:hypothetical protein